MTKPTGCIPPRRAFTLIELLIVVMIIAVLAAIAVPNFLEAQTRAKVARTRADLRTIATGIEAYATDNNNHYPLNDGGYNVLPLQLSTPVAYMTSTKLLDPFSTKEFVFIPGINPEAAKEYSYLTVISSSQERVRIINEGGPPAPNEALGYGNFNPTALQRYGKWRISGNGPDRRYSGSSASGDPGYNSPDGPWNTPASVLLGLDIPYDPTNGTVSWGDLVRTQINAEMALP